MIRRFLSGWSSWLVVQGGGFRSTKGPLPIFGKDLQTSESDLSHLIACTRALNTLAFFHDFLSVSDLGVS